MDKRLFLLDAYALIFRAYYALIRNPRITSKGKNTNAQFGFTNTLVELINNGSTLVDAAIDEQDAAVLENCQLNSLAALVRAVR